MSGNGCECKDRVEDLKEDLAALEERFQAWRKHTVSPRFEEIESRSDDARSERAELRATITDLQSEVANLQFALEAFKGLDEHQETSPAARVRDLRLTMIERVQTFDERAGVKLWWKEVRDVFADCGHGEVKAPECHKAMEEAAEADGFELVTKVNENSNEVKAIRLKAAALPAAQAVSDPTNANGVSAVQNGGESAEIHNDD